MDPEISLEFTFIDQSSCFTDVPSRYTIVSNVEVTKNNSSWYSRIIFISVILVTVQLFEDKYRNSFDVVKRSFHPDVNTTCPVLLVFLE